MGEVGRISQRFLQDHTGSYDRASDVPDRIRNGNPDNFSWTAIPELFDSGCGITYNYEWKLQRHCAEPECPATL